MASRVLKTYDVARVSAYILTHKDIDINTIGMLREHVEEVYQSIYPLVEGVVVLSTCNRFEVYMDADDISNPLNVLSRLLGPIYAHGRLLKGVNAIYHLFKVAAGLDSAILGENEVLGQVNNAWQYAKANAYSSRLLDVVFHGAIVAGRRARRETAISKGVIGYPEAAVRLAEAKLGSLDGLNILIIGAGDAAKRIAERICYKYNPSMLTIANRDKFRAEKLISLLRCKRCTAIGLDQLSTLDSVDVVFIAVYGNPRLDDIIDKAKIVIDISTPPVLAPKEGKVFTFNDVDALVKTSITTRASEIPKVEKIIAEEIERLKRIIAERKADVAVSAIMRFARRVMSEEIEETIRALRSNKPVDKVLELAFWSYTKKLLRPLILTLRRMAIKGYDEFIETIYNNYIDPYNISSLEP